MAYFNEKSKRNYTFHSYFLKIVKINQVCFFKTRFSCEIPFKKNNNFSISKDLTKKNFSFLDL